MTAATYRSTPSLSVPQTQNTAPVLEFACLYTHDLRKKAKKWQDGVLRYHTFNKRAMVYDVPRNFIGDMHWTGGEDLQEGDEVLLEKAGVKVEVAERIGETETDLSELRASKGPAVNGEPRRRTDMRPVAAATPIAKGSSEVMPRGNTHLKHKSLNALLGTPKGTMGKAVLPTKSPFEERYANVENEEWEDGRPAKKARVAETKKSKTASKQAEVPLWARTSDSKATPQIQRPAGKVFIDLSDDLTPSNDFLPGFSSDALAPSSPMRAAARDVSGSSSSPALRTGRPPEILATVAGKEKGRAHQMRVLDHGHEEDEMNHSTRRPRKLQKSPQPARQPSLQPSRASLIKPGQTLRLAASAPKKGTLLCQDQLAKKPQRTPSAENEALMEVTVDVSDKDAQPKTAKERVQERLEQISRRRARTSNTGATTSMTNHDVSKPSNGDDDLRTASSRSANEATHSLKTSIDDKAKRRAQERVLSEKSVANVAARPRPLHQPLDAPSESHGTLASGVGPSSENFGQRSSHEISAIELARLDRMMLPPAAPRRAPTPPVPVPSPREIRPLRRVISEPPVRPNAGDLTAQAKPASKRVPGAPVRYTPTPSPTKRSRESTPVPPTEMESRIPIQNKAKNKLQKSVSLNVTAAGTSTVILGRPFQAPGKPRTVTAKKPDPPPDDVGPWSREAFDLFKWRPPGWDEEKWCVVEAVEGVGDTTTAPAGLSGGVSLPSVLKDLKRGL